MAYNAITTHAISKAGDKSILLVTGQPGIGKFFQHLKYQLIKLDRQDIFLVVLSFPSTPRAGTRRPPDQCATICHRRPTRRASVSCTCRRDLWNSEGHLDPFWFFRWTTAWTCDAFRKSKAHLLHTSSPSSHGWKDWMKQLSARTALSPTFILSVGWPSSIWIERKDLLIF